MTQEAKGSTIEHMCADFARAANQARIARIAGVDRSTVVRVLNRDPHARVGEATRARILSAAARVGYDFGRVRRIHRRASERIPVDLPVTVTIRAGGAIHAQGTARVRAINVAGLRLDELQCRPPTLPLVPCFIQVKFAANAGLVAMCQPVHLTHGRSLSIGARFTRLSRSGLQRVRSLVEQTALAAKERKR